MGVLAHESNSEERGQINVTQTNLIKSKVSAQHKKRNSEKKGGQTYVKV